MALNTRIQTRRDTAANWEAKNPVLLDGEMIIVITNAGDTRFKIGDGTKTYTQLPFQDETLYNVLSGKADAAELTTKADVEHTHSWSEVTDKPVVTEGGDTLTWDGNTEGLVSADFSDMSWGVFYKVSDAIPTLDDFVNGYTYCSQGSVWDETAVPNEMTTGVLSIFTEIFIVSEDGVGQSGIANSSTVFPESGVYFKEGISYITILNYTGFSKEVLDPDYLPAHTHELSEHKHAWNDIENTPFVTKPEGGDTLTWDGNTDGNKNTSEISDITYYFVSSVAPTEDDFANGCEVTYSDGTSESVTVEKVMDGLPMFYSDGKVYVDSDYGIYFAHTGDRYVASITITGYTGFPKEVLDPDCLPEHTHDEYVTETELTTALSSKADAAELSTKADASEVTELSAALEQKSQVQIITWEADD